MSNPVSKILLSINLILDDEMGSIASSGNMKPGDLTSDTSRVSLNSEMIELLLDENMETQNDCFQKFQSLNYSNESRRKIIKHCLDLKRIIDKESNVIYAGNIQLIWILWFKRCYSQNQPSQILQPFLDVSR
jgi:hypothetical protein